MPVTFLDVVWMTAAAVIIVMAPAARMLPSGERHLAYAAMAAAMFIGMTTTLIFNRVTRGLWLPGRDGKGASSRGRWGVALIVMISGYLTLQLLHILPWWEQ